MLALEARIGPAARARAGHAGGAADHVCVPGPEWASTERVGPECGSTERGGGTVHERALFGGCSGTRPLPPIQSVPHQAGPRERPVDCGQAARHLPDDRVVGQERAAGVSHGVALGRVRESWIPGRGRTVSARRRQQAGRRCDSCPRHRRRRRTGCPRRCAPAPSRRARQNRADRQPRAPGRTDQPTSQPLGVPERLGGGGLIAWVGHAVSIQVPRHNCQPTSSHTARSRSWTHHID